MSPCTPFVDSAYGRLGVYLSSTRPTGADRYEGKAIYELNTDRIYAYTGAAWVLVGWTTAAGRPGVILTDAAQSIGNSAATDITWSTEVSDVDGWTSGGSATLTVPTGWDGIYLVTYSGVWAAASGVLMGAACTYNGANVYSTSDGALWGAPTLTFMKAMAASDTLKFQVFQNSGGAVNITSRLEITWIGR